jgi:hypothetical protein
VAQQFLDDFSASSCGFFLLEAVDEVDEIEEAAAGFGPDDGGSNGDRQMSFSCACRSSDILPGIRTPREKYTTGSIPVLVRRPFLCGVIAFRAWRCLSSSRGMELWRIYPAG